MEEVADKIMEEAACMFKGSYEVRTSKIRSACFHLGMRVLVRWLKWLLIGRWGIQRLHIKRYEGRTSKIEVDVFTLEWGTLSDG